MVVVGVDIAARGFAFAVAEGGRIVEEGVAGVRELASLFRKYRVEKLAVDNMGELVTYARPLVKLLGRLPYTVEIIEVTRGPNGYRKMEDLVREILGVAKGKLEPGETAVYLSILAERGVGTPVKLFEEETVVLVHRRISTTPGGMSRNRYMRNITHRIKSIASKIEAALKEAKLDYDLFIKEESGEISSAKFVVYAPRETVRKYVKPMRSIDVAVSIFSVPSKGGEGGVGKRYLIVGVDPGTVTGVAVLTLDGEVLDTVARRGLSRGEVVRYLRQWGVPVVVATDVGDPPEYVKKLAAMTGAVLYTPGRDLTSEEKSALVERSGWRVRTSHERDALAAALKAYAEFKQKFEKVEKDFNNILSFEQLENIKALIVRGYSISQAFTEVLKPRGEGETKIIYVPVEKPCAQKDEELEAKIRALEHENRELYQELEALKREYHQLKRTVEDEKWKDVKYRELQARIENLTKELMEREKELVMLKKIFIEILLNYGFKYRLVHAEEVVECKGGEPAGTICKNLDTIEDAVAKKSLGVPLREVIKLDFGDLYVVDLEKMAEISRQIRERLDNSEVDLKKIIQQYRRGLVF